MLAFWRRSRGRHALGAAVTGLPAGAPVRAAAPPSVPLVPSAVPSAVPSSVLPSTAEPVPSVTPLAVPPVPSAVVAPVPAPPPVAPPAVPAARVDQPGPVAARRRVELGFRDGSRASLDPSSEQARALEDLAAVLTRRD